MFIFSGNVGKEAVVKTTTSGKQVVEYSVAVYAGKDKDKNAQTLWVKCSKWFDAGKEIPAWELPGKGDFIIVNCVPNPLRTYEAADGTTKPDFSVMVNSIETRKATADPGGYQKPEGGTLTDNRPGQGNTYTAPSLASKAADEDDLPF